MYTFEDHPDTYYAEVDHACRVRPGTRRTTADHPAAVTYADTHEATERIGPDRARVARYRNA
jgi:hypothetical protein